MNKVLMLNAGIIGPEHGSVDKVTREEIAQLVWTNALAPIRIAECLLPRVVDGGTVAFVLSVLPYTKMNSLRKQVSGNSAE